MSSVNSSSKGTFNSDRLLDENVSSNEMETLLKAGANPNVSTYIRETPLHIHSDLERVSLLLSYGANPNFLTDTNNSPLHYKKSSDSVLALLRAGADPNATNLYGNTPLYKQLDKKSVQHLLKYGAKINVKNEFGKPPDAVNMHLRSFLFWKGVRVLSYIGIGLGVGFLMYRYYSHA